MRYASLRGGLAGARRVNCLPVVDDLGKLRGILTTTDLMLALQKLQLAIELLPESQSRRS